MVVFRAVKRFYLWRLLKQLGLGTLGNGLGLGLVLVLVLGLGVSVMGYG